MKLHEKPQALVEMPSVEAAAQALLAYEYQVPMIRGQRLYLDYSFREELGDFCELGDSRAEASSPQAIVLKPIASPRQAIALQPIASPQAIVLKPIVEVPNDKPIAEVIEVHNESEHQEAAFRVEVEYRERINLDWYYFRGPSSLNRSQPLSIDLRERQRSEKQLFGPEPQRRNNNGKYGNPARDRAHGQCFHLSRFLNIHRPSLSRRAEPPPRRGPSCRGSLFESRRQRAQGPAPTPQKIIRLELGLRQLPLTA